LHFVTLTHSNLFKVEENPPFFNYFLIQFSDGEVKAAADFHIPSSFSLKNKIIVGNSKEPHPLCVCFLIQFSKGEVKAAEDFHISISFLFENEKNSTFSNLDFFLFSIIGSPSVPCGCSLSVPCCTPLHSCSLLPLSAVAVRHHHCHNRCRHQKPLLPQPLRLPLLLYHQK
jgi:hypothetical protein